MLNRAAWFAAMLVLGLPQSYAGEHERGWWPAGVHAEPVGQGMRINGLPTDVLRLHGAVNAKQLRDAFLSQDSIHALPPAQIEGWELLATPVAGGMQTLQLRTNPDGDVEAIFAITDLSRGASRPPDGAPLRLSGDALITSVVESADMNLRGTQYVAWSRMPPAELRRRLCSRAKTQGWQIRDCDSPAIDMVRTGGSLIVTVAAATGLLGGGSGLRSVVVMNHVRSGP